MRRYAAQTDRVCRKFFVGTQGASSGRGLCRQGVELFSRCEALCHLTCPLIFPHHVHELDPDQRALVSSERLQSPHGPGHPLHSSVNLRDDIVTVCDLTDDDRGAVSLIVDPKSRCVGLAPVDGDRGGDAVPAYCLGEKTFGSPLVPRLGEQKVNGLAGLIDGTIQIAPLHL
jgi:hypothetical protein